MVVLYLICADGGDAGIVSYMTVLMVEMVVLYLICADGGDGGIVSYMC